MVQEIPVKQLSDFTRTCTYSMTKQGIDLFDHVIALV